MRIKQAERRLNRLDPLPDLDNANVGIYRHEEFRRICQFGISAFWRPGGQSGISKNRRKCNAWKMF